MYSSDIGGAFVDLLVSYAGERYRALFTGELWRATVYAASRIYELGRAAGRKGEMKPSRSL